MSRTSKKDKEPSFLDSSQLKPFKTFTNYPGVKITAIGNGGIDAQLKIELDSNTSIRITPSRFNHGSGDIQTLNFKVSLRRMLVAGGASMTVDLNATKKPATAFLDPQNGTFVILNIPKGKTFLIDDDSFVGCSTNIVIKVKRMKGTSMFMGTGLFEAALTAEEEDGFAILHTVARVKVFDLSDEKIVMNARDVLYRDTSLITKTKSIGTTWSTKLMSGLLFLYVKGGTGKIAMFDREDDVSVMNRMDTNVRNLTYMAPCRG